MKIKLILSGLLASIAIQHGHTAVGLQKATAPYVISDYAKTKYPIVLTHGMMGFTRLGTQTFGVDYWYQITPDLARNGATVFVTQVSPVNTAQFRGEQLLQQVDEVIALTGKNKVNLIGHSHGGPTVRYIEAVAPKKVASVTGVAGSMKGMKIPTMIYNSPVLNLSGRVIMKALATAVSITEGNPFLPNDTKAALYSYTDQGMNEFNAKYPSAAIPINCYSDGQKITSNGVYHYSWSGNRQVTNIFDILDTPIVGAGGLLLAGLENDGIVEICSSNYGHVIRNNYNLNHFDEVNQTLGIKSRSAPEPSDLFRQHANRLKIQGL